MQWILTKLKVMISENKGLKLAALVMAVAAWYAIQGITNYEALVTEVPIKVYLPDGVSVLDRSTDTVDVRFRGAKEETLYLSKDRVSAFIDLREAPFQDEHVIDITLNNIEVPGSARPVSVRPAVLRLSLDREDTRRIPVKASLTGAPRSGYAIERAVCSPPFVTVTGPRERLKNLDLLRTRNVSVDQRSKDFESRVHIDTADEDWISAIDPREIQVAVRFRPEQLKTLQTERPVRVLLPPGATLKTRVSPDRAIITVQGTQTALDKLDMSPATLYVDCSDLTETGAYDLPITVHVPEGISVISTEPAAVRVSLQPQEK